MIYIITPHYSDFLIVCRESNVNAKEYNTVIHVNTFMKLLGRRIKEGDEIKMSRTYDFSLEEYERIFKELKMRGAII